MKLAPGKLVPRHGQKYREGHRFLSLSTWPLGWFLLIALSAFLEIAFAMLSAKFKLSESPRLLFFSYESKTVFHTDCQVSHGRRLRKRPATCPAGQ
jgi:hypothetical protein